MLKYLIVAAFIPILALATPFRSCPNGAPVPQEFSIEGCSTLPCTLVRGQPLIAEALRITSPASTNNVEAFINVFLAGLDLEFPMPPERADACASGIQSCPLVAGQLFDYIFEDPALEVPLGGLTVVIRVGLRDGATQIGCIEFDGTIV